MTDQKDRKIAKLTQERDDWQRRAERAETENADLRRQLERQQMMAGIATGGMMERIDATIEHLQRERDKWINYALEVNPFLNADVMRRLSSLRQLPSNTDLQAVSEETGQPFYRWGEACQLAGVLYIKSEYHADAFGVKIHMGAYPGTLETFQTETLPALSALIGRTPTLADIGNKSIPGISTDELLNICELLTPHRDSTGRYQEYRLHMFEQYWPQIETAASYEVTKKGHYKARRDFKKLFNDYLDAIFEARDKRLRTPISQL